MGGGEVGGEWPGSGFVILQDGVRCYEKGSFLVAWV